MKRRILNIFLFLMIISSLLLFSGCEMLTLSDITTSTNTTLTNSNNENNNTNQVINLYINDVSSSTPTSVEEAIDKVYDSVVVINSYMTNGYSSGSGVVIASSETYTYIVTCHHVIDSATSYEVILSTGEIINASLVGGDPTTDIAVLKINKVDLYEVPFIANSSNIKLGSTAIAIGNPLGILANTVTVGCVSYVNREIQSSDGTIETLIQTDAAINSGNSGGGLFDDKGNLIGIVSSKYSSSGVEGLGFAVPANTVRNIVSDLLEFGYVEGRYNLGLTISEGYTRGSFMGQMTLVTYISAVDELGCAANLLYANDIISKITIDYKDETKDNEEYTISTSEEAYQVINKELVLGDKLIFSIIRGSQSKTVEVTLTQYIYR